MKTRIGFVSNSSSSSFIVIGRRITMQEAEALLKQEKRNDIIADINYSGASGEYIVNVNNNMFKILKRASKGEFDYYYTYSGTNTKISQAPKFYEVFKSSESNKISFDSSILPPIKCSAFFWEKDYYCPKDPNSLLQLFEERKRNNNNER